MEPNPNLQDECAGADGGPIKSVLGQVFYGSNMEGSWGVASEFSRAERSITSMFRFRAYGVALKSRHLFSADTEWMRCYVILVTSGHITGNHIGQPLAFGSGEIFLLFNWLPHELNITEETEVTILSIPGWWMSKEALPDEALNYGSYHIPADFPSAAPLATLVENIRSADISEDLANEGMLMIARLLRGSISYLTKNNDNKIPKIGRMARLFGVVSQNLDREGFTPADAAGLIQCSVRTLHATCAESGTTFNQLLMDMRLHWAAYRLRSTDERVSEIAYGCGFASFPHFCRMFKERFGVSAGQHRAERGSGTGPAR